MIPIELRQLTDSFFAANEHNYDFSTIEGCGKYMEALIPYAQAHGYPKVGFLKYTGPGTKYNNHRIDSFLYNDKDTFNNKLQSVDVIANAETDHASAGWGPDTPRYSEEDWVETLEELIGDENGEDEPNTIPWVPYWGDPTSDKITRTFMYDYQRAGQSLNPGFGRWLNRCLHSAFMGPEGIPLGPDGALARHRPELCAALGRLDPNVPIPDDFYPEWK